MVNTILMGKAEATPLTPELVQHMIDNEGIYLCGDSKAPEATIVIASMGGELHCLEPDFKMDPERFLETLTVSGPFYKDNYFDLVQHLERQREFSLKTFGPGARTKGVLDHVRKELKEIEAEPNDLEEWIDLVMLALDGAWRAGYTPEQIAAQLEAKQTKNEGREWPDWRTAEPGKAIEHVRETD